MFLSIFYRLLFSHMVCDFLLQSSRLSNQRYNRELRLRIAANLKHCLIHLAGALVITLPVIGWTSVKVSLLVFFIHLLIDYTKSMIIVSYPFEKYSAAAFIADQLLHIITSIFITCMVCSVPMNTIISFFYIDNLLKLYYIPLDLEQKLFLAFSLIIFASWGMGIFIKLFLSWLGIKNYKRALNLNIEISSLNEHNGSLEGGFIIGILERIFIICSMVLRTPEVIGFVLATKSIARFKKFDDDRFVETFIIGSFISFISAIIVGIIIRNLNI